MAASQAIAPDQSSGGALGIRVLRLKLNDRCPRVIAFSVTIECHEGATYAVLAAQQDARRLIARTRPCALSPDHRRAEPAGGHTAGHVTYPGHKGLQGDPPLLTDICTAGHPQPLGVRPLHVARDDLFGVKRLLFPSVGSVSAGDAQRNARFADRSAGERQTLSTGHRARTDDCEQEASARSGRRPIMTQLADNRVRCTSLSECA